VIKRKCFKEHGLYDIKYKILSDFHFLVRIFKSKAKFLYLNCLIAHHDRKGISSDTDLARKERKAIIQEMYSEAEIANFKPSAKNRAMMLRRLLSSKRYNL
jgi:hypothetical protein